MLPKFRIIVVAMIATCAAVLALSASMLGSRDPVRHLSGVPDVTLVREALIEEPESQQSQLLAYSRRADELMRLRDLPVRAVVEYAEQAQARAAETASAPAASSPTATAPVEAATPPPLAAPASESAPTIVATAPVATPPADALGAPAADSGAGVATPSADTPTVATVAVAPVATPPADTSAAADTPATTVDASTSVAAPPADTTSATAIVPAPASPPEVRTPAAAPADAQVAAVQTGGSETAEMYGPTKPKAEPKKRRAPKTVHARPAKPKTKPQQVARTTRSVAPAASTGFPADQPNNRSSTVGNWRSGSESTMR